MVQLEDIFSIFIVQVFCNNINNNSHDIIGWDPNKGKNNVDRVTLVTVDASEVFTGVGSMS